MLSNPFADALAGDLEFVKALTLEAAQIARSRAGKVTPHEKANLSFVTDLDQDLERFIRARIKARFPDETISGEEYETTEGTGTRRWSIDPIDGTGNLVHGLPIWAVSIGLLDQGEPILGVIAIPPLNELYWAVKGGGAWRDGEAIHSAPDAEEFHPQDNVCLGTNAMRAIDPRSLPGRLRDLGSACSELAFVSCGRLVSCAFLGEQTHDVAAGIVIAAEAGCRIATIDGDHLTPSRFVSSTPVPIPTFIAPPRRLEKLINVAKRLFAH